MKFKDNSMRRRDGKVSGMSNYAEYAVHDLTDRSQRWVKYCLPKLLFTAGHPGGVLALLIDEDFNRFKRLISRNCDS
jgi:hypothetical protein